MAQEAHALIMSYSVQMSTDIPCSTWAAGAVVTRCRQQSVSDIRDNNGSVPQPGIPTVPLLTYRPASQDLQIALDFEQSLTSCLV